MFKENNLNAIILAIFGFSLQFAGFGLTPEFNPWTWVMWTVWAVAANRLVRHFSSDKEDVSACAATDRRTSRRI